MDTPRVRISHEKDEVAPNTWEDFAWAREHRDELLQQFGEGVILVYEKHVVGKGTTLQEAADDANRNVSPDSPQITPIIYLLGYRHPFFRIRPTLKADS